jgi:anti-anti-sigma regulatory factor
MQVKIDTKEKFTVITPEETSLNDSFSETLKPVLLDCLQKPVKNVVLNLKNVISVHEVAANNLAATQQEFYENNASFVICEVKSEIETQLDEFQLLDLLNVTPTESEAWDIVQMEEIERELMDGDDVEFEK